MVTSIGLWLLRVSLPAALVSLALRFRAARGVERQQLRWVAAAPSSPWPSPCREGSCPLVTYAAVLCPPMAVAVLRYRLWDLDRLVNHTVTYALVSALIVMPYLLIVPAWRRAS